MQVEHLKKNANLGGGAQKREGRKSDKANETKSKRDKKQILKSKVEVYPASALKGLGLVSSQVTFILSPAKLFTCKIFHLQIIQPENIYGWTNC